MSVTFAATAGTPFDVRRLVISPDEARLGVRLIRVGTDIVFDKSHKAIAVPADLYPLHVINYALSRSLVRVHVPKDVMLSVETEIQEGYADQVNMLAFSRYEEQGGRELSYVMNLNRFPS